MIETSTLEKAAQSGISRRRFFGYAGALAGAVGGREQEDGVVSQTASPRAPAPCGLPLLDCEPGRSS